MPPPLWFAKLGIQQPGNKEQIPGADKVLRREEMSLSQVFEDLLCQKVQYLEIARNRPKCQFSFFLFKILDSVMKIQTVRTCHNDVFIL